MKFEQAGVRNIRERKAANETRRYREQNGDNTPPRKGTIEYLIWEARQKRTLEELDAMRKAASARLHQMDLDNIERHRCRTCGADTINYSHSFTCPWRGTGF